MKTFDFNSFEEAYPQLLKTLMDEGAEVSPRGMLTKEIAPVGITINNPKKRVISHKDRKNNYGFMVAELLWMLRKSNDVEEIGHYNRQWFKFSDDGKTLNGAYGQRIFDWDGMFDIWQETQYNEQGNPSTTFECEHIVINQFEKAYEQLKADPDTRQATIVLFNPVQDYRETKDKPCTNLIRFMIRNGKLNMTVFMRSNDIILGFPYDIYNFTMMQEIMAGKLGIEVGKYTHIADSLHIYEMHFEMANQIINSENSNLYDDKYVLADYRLSNEDLNEELKKVMDIEAVTRLQSEIIKIDIVEKMLKEINSESWKSLAAVIATYNFRKSCREQSELDKLKTYITNEFARIPELQNWQPLNKK